MTSQELADLVALWEAGGMVGPDPRVDPAPTSRAVRFARGDRLDTLPPITTWHRTLPGMPPRQGQP